MYRPERRGGRERATIGARKGRGLKAAYETEHRRVTVGEILSAVPLTIGREMCALETDPVLDNSPYGKSVTDTIVRIHCVERDELMAIIIILDLREWTCISNSRIGSLRNITKRP